VVSPNDFADLVELSRTLLAFVDRYNQTARPFNWKFIASDLTGLLRRISNNEQPRPAASQPGNSRVTPHPDEFTRSPTWRWSARLPQKAAHAVAGDRPGHPLRRFRCARPMGAGDR
jgi:hypothetical protein